MKKEKEIMTRKQSKIYGIISMILGFAVIGGIMGILGLWFFRFEDPVDRLNCKYAVVIGLIVLLICIAFYFAWPFLSELLNMLETA